MEAYLNIINKIIQDGEVKDNRTGVNTIAIAGTIFEHDMSLGFPLLTTKFVPIRLVASELEFFIKGITNKNWLKERNNHIWDEWCNPSIVKYGNDDESKAAMAAESELGPIYGYQWRHFGAKYITSQSCYDGMGVDQLKKMVDTLHSNPHDRRMIVSAWNPTDIPKMALPPCHWGFQVTVINGKLNLLWNQRSVDTALGLPFNIASYGLLLLLLAKEGGFKPGKLIGFLGDTHIYSNHLAGLLEQMKRRPHKLPQLEIREFSSIFDWEYENIELIDYQYQPRIAFEIAV